MTTEPDKMIDGIFEEAVFTSPIPDLRVEEPVHIKGFKATYDRKFNLGNFESLQAEISIWVKTRVLENSAFNLHDCKRRVRNMARENVKAQYQRVADGDSLAFLGLEAPQDDQFGDPIYVATVGVGLTYKVNLGNYSMITPAYTDWADLRAVALDAQSGLHIAIARLWDGLWANTRDEIARARGEVSTEDDFGLPAAVVEDLTNEAYAGGNGRLPAVINGNGNGSR